MDDSNVQYAELICPFCEGKFEIPPFEEDVDPTTVEYVSSCGCGACYCLEEAEDVYLVVIDLNETAEEDGKTIEIRYVQRVDYWTTSEDPNHVFGDWESVTAVFFKFYLFSDGAWNLRTCLANYSRGSDIRSRCRT
ncbi:MAG: hypothetical protein O2877_01560 [bacterium]|nr:hypothetical protein [bacterium]